MVGQTNNNNNILQKLIVVHFAECRMFSIYIGTIDSMIEPGTKMYKHYFVQLYIHVNILLYLTALNFIDQHYASYLN